MTEPSATPLVSIEHLSKTFPGALWLDGGRQVPSRSVPPLAGLGGLILLPWQRRCRAPAAAMALALRERPASSSSRLFNKRLLRWSGCTGG
jgi:hypothetical protein